VRYIADLLGLYTPI